VTAEARPWPDRETPPLELRRPYLARRLLPILALVIVYGWMLQTLVIAGNALLNQHPTGLLLTSITRSHQEPPDGVRQAIIVAAHLLPAKASIDFVHRTDQFTNNYAYYWATYNLYPRHVVMAETTTLAAADSPDYILDIGGTPPPTAIQPPGYQIGPIIHFHDGTVMTILARG
jgi:hypothetical protein